MTLINMNSQYEYDPREYIDLDDALEEEETRSIYSSPENTTNKVRNGPCFKYSLKSIDEKEAEHLRLSLITPLSSRRQESPESTWRPARYIRNIADKSMSPTPSYQGSSNESVLLFKNIANGDNESAIDFASSDLKDFMGSYNMDDLISRPSSRTPTSSYHHSLQRLNKDSLLSTNQRRHILSRNSSSAEVRMLINESPIAAIEEETNETRTPSPSYLLRNNNNSYTKNDVVQHVTSRPKTHSTVNNTLHAHPFSRSDETTKVTRKSSFDIGTQTYQHSPKITLKKLSISSKRQSIDSGLQQLHEEKKQYHDQQGDIITRRLSIPTSPSCIPVPKTTLSKPNSLRKKSSNQGHWNSNNLEVRSSAAEEYNNSSGTRQHRSSTINTRYDMSKVLEKRRSISGRETIEEQTRNKPEQSRYGSHLTRMKKDTSTHLYEENEEYDHNNESHYVPSSARIQRITSEDYGTCKAQNYNSDNKRENQQQPERVATKTYPSLLNKDTARTSIQRNNPNPSSEMQVLPSRSTDGLSDSTSSSSRSGDLYYDPPVTTATSALPPCDKKAPIQYRHSMMFRDKQPLLTAAEKRRSIPVFASREGGAGIEEPVRRIEYRYSTSTLRQLSQEKEQPPYMHNTTTSNMNHRQDLYYQQRDQHHLPQQKSYRLPPHAAAVVNNHEQYMSASSDQSSRERIGSGNNRYGDSLIRSSVLVNPDTTNNTTRRRGATMTETLANSRTGSLRSLHHEIDHSNRKIEEENVMNSARKVLAAVQQRRKNYSSYR